MSQEITNYFRSLGRWKRNPESKLESRQLLVSQKSLAGEKLAWFRIEISGWTPLATGFGPGKNRAWLGFSIRCLMLWGNLTNWTLTLFEMNPSLVSILTLRQTANLRRSSFRQSQVSSISSACHLDGGFVPQIQIGFCPGIETPSAYACILYDIMIYYVHFMHCAFCRFLS